MHLWANTITNEHFADIEKIKEVGYDGIEVFLAEPDKKSYQELGPFLKSIGLEVNGCLGLGPEADPISADAAVRKNAVEVIKTAIDNMHLAGGKNICGPFHSAFATFSRNSPQEEEYKRSAEVLREVADHAAQADIMLTPEALNRFECYLCNTMAQLKKLVDMVDHPNVKGMFDPHPKWGIAATKQTPRDAASPEAFSLSLTVPDFCLNPSKPRDCPKHSKR